MLLHFLMQAESRERMLLAVHGDGGTALSRVWPQRLIRILVFEPRAFFLFGGSVSKTRVEDGINSQCYIFCNMRNFVSRNRGPLTSRWDFPVGSMA